MDILEKLRSLTDDQLIVLSEEMQLAIIPEDALIRKIFNEVTNFKGMQFHEALLLMSVNLLLELAQRLITSKMELNTFKR